nr:hypothetical protein [Pseudomonas sp. BF-R-24]
MPTVQVFDSSPKVLDVVLALQNDYLVVIHGGMRPYPTEIYKQAEKMLKKANIKGSLILREVLLPADNTLNWTFIMFLHPQFALDDKEIVELGGTAIDAWLASKKKLPYIHRE